MVLLFLELVYRLASLATVIGAAMVLLASILPDQTARIQGWALAGAGLTLLSAMAMVCAGRLREGFNAWRSLSERQHRTLVRCLEGRAIGVWNTYVHHDQEAAFYRQQLERALREAGVRTSYYSGWSSGVGVTVLGRRGAALDALAGAFRKAGIPIRVVHPSTRFARAASSDVTVIVGSRP